MIPSSCVYIFRDRQTSCSLPDRLEIRDWEAWGGGWLNGDIGRGLQAAREGVPLSSPGRSLRRLLSLSDSFLSKFSSLTSLAF